MLNLSTNGLCLSFPGSSVELSSNYLIFSLETSASKTVPGKTSAGGKF